MSKKPAADAAAAPEKKSKKKLIIMIVAVLAIAGGVYKFVLAPKPKPGPPKAGETVKMDPTILNLADGHYLKIGISVQLVEGKATAEKFDSAEATNMVIDMFSGRNRATLNNATRLKLQKDLATEVKKAYPGEVYALYLNTFLVD